MSKSDTLNEIAERMKELPDATQRCVVVVAEMLSKGMVKQGMDIPSNAEYLRSRLIGSQEEVNFQVTETIQYFEMINTRSA